MKHSLFTRVCCLFFCLFLLPATALAQEEAPKPVIRSDFSLSLALHADGFPEKTTRLSDWEAFLNKLSISGYVNAMDYPDPYSRVYMAAGLQVNGKERIPFVYDGYHSYRYLISPLFKGESIHFQMHNFFQFMLKPYYFMGLPTQYIALPMYPEATVYLLQAYGQPIAEALAGEGTRTVSYEKLYALCEQLNLLANYEEDPSERVYYYLTCLLGDIGASDTTHEALMRLEEYLAFLDPAQQGMTITVESGSETYQLGDYTLLEKTAGETGENRLVLTLPNAEGYELRVEYEWLPGENGALLSAGATVTLEEEAVLTVHVQGEGLPTQGQTDAQGEVSISFGGSSLSTPTTQRFAFRLAKSTAEFPCELRLDVDWLHPQTQAPAFSLALTADLQEVGPDVFVEGAYNQDDFFSLNDSILEELKEKYMATIALAALPVVMEMPAGVIDSILEFAGETGILASLGIE